MKELILNGGGRPVYTDDLKIIQDNAAMFERFFALDTKVKEQGCVLCGCEVAKGQNTADGYTKNYVTVSEGYVFLDGKVRHVSPVEYTWEIDAAEIPYPLYIIPEDKSSEEVIQYVDNTDANLYVEYSAKVITELQNDGDYSKILSLKYTTSGSDTPNRFPNFYDLWDGTTNSSLIDNFKEVVKNAQTATTEAQNAAAKATEASQKANTATTNVTDAINLANDAITKAQTATNTANEAAKKSDQAVTEVRAAAESVSNVVGRCEASINSANLATETAMAAATNTNNATEELNTALNTINLATEQANTAKAECEDQIAKAKNATGLAELAANKANTAISNCETATTATEKVDATLADGYTLTITNRSGEVKTIALPSDVASVGERLTEVEEKVAKATDSYMDCMFCKTQTVYIDGEAISVEPYKRYRFSPQKEFRFNVDAWNSYIVYCDMTHLDTSTFTTPLIIWSNAFQGAKFEVIHGIAGLDMSNVTAISGWFTRCQSLRAVDLSGWDTRNLTTIYSPLFEHCTKLERVIGALNLPKVQGVACMFRGCTSLTSLDVSQWDLQSATNMSSTFMSCTSLTSLDVSNWNTQNVTDMASMFWGCNKLTTLDPSNWNTQNVTDMTSMFWNCAVASFDLSKWNTRSLTNASEMFCQCSNLTSVGDLSGWDTSQVTDMSYMFANCQKLNNLNVSKWDVRKVTNFDRMFSGCNSLTTLDVSRWDLQSATNIYGMFWDCTSSTSLDLSNWDVSKCTSLQNMFFNCPKLTALDLSGWDLSSVIHTENMFAGCCKLANIKLGEGFGKMTNNVTEVNFESCPWTENVDTLLLLYDRAANGLNNVTLRLHKDTKAKLTEANMASLTAKGYVIA